MEHHQVVIIGAGIAGLRCAHQLVHEKGVKDVLVVDAQDHIGGRILANTDFIPGMTIEVGAELLHGANTTLTKLAEEKQWNLREIFTWAQVSDRLAKPSTYVDGKNQISMVVAGISGHDDVS